jgi:hypothetical protein
MRLKIAVLAPIPRASDTTATAVNAPFRRIVRKAYRRSCQSIPHFHGHYTVY